MHCYAASKPNIVFVYTDDQAPWALGLSGHPHASTPNMDKLFRRGAYLPNSFTVTPVCSPSRASLISSRYGSEVGLTDWINPRREPVLGLGADVLTWPRLLRESGYRTGLVGKWHLGLLDEQHPTQRGYEFFTGFRGGGTTPMNPVLEKAGKERQFEGLTADILTTELPCSLSSGLPGKSGDEEPWRRVFPAGAAGGRGLGGSGFTRRPPARGRAARTARCGPRAGGCRAGRRAGA